MQLTSENDKMKMIDIAINPINEFIKSFFNELESNKKNDDNDIGKNVLNINGSWGSGKSTIVNNLEETTLLDLETRLFSNLCFFVLQSTSSD
ncbi:P-loop NTPase fold protein [Spiroplasma endosymbiont of Danaus chrysippus]|uniref:P-loop NTPase fold protein n=1 Tax=Spiroplasma endosymbiont of Danaus chrysippus TaxID=2691041 RepID=UPI0013C88D0F|nr:P-loop NTPase fold protein [Spiroplasma endosymbiont of Danaus chrysippus]CAB1053832.1 hypothetical protein [Spiroplasma endosymbiont of Danaus chrysippus]